MKTIMGCLALFLITGVVSQAEDAAKSGADLGAPTVVDEFDRAELGSKWSVAKGSWTIVDGAIVAKELKSDMHAAVLSFNHPNHNSVVEFSFMLDGNKSFNLSFNKARGHLFRVAVAPDRIAVTLDKDKKDPDSKAQRLAATKATFEPGKWYTLRVTVDGETVTVTTDNGVKLTAQHADINQPKPNYRFVMTGESLKLDNLKIWDLPVKPATAAK